MRVLFWYFSTVPCAYFSYCWIEIIIETCNLIYVIFIVGNVQKFPRTSVWDPYKRLGVSRDASEEEIWGSRNFLLQQYAGHERSEESIEAAFEKLLMASFRQRKKTKINLKTRLKKKVEESPPWVQNLLNYVELPPTDVILRRLFLFAFMGGWSIMNSAESGPAFQVFSYFIHHICSFVRIFNVCIMLSNNTLSFSFFPFKNRLKKCHFLIKNCRT